MKRDGRPHAEPARTRDWLLAALAAFGLAVMGYLTVGRLASVKPLFCEAGGGCDVVQASHYATFIGLPTAAWGAAFFAVIGALALAGLGGRRWLAAFVLAAGATAFSGYLTWVALTELRAACGWCLTGAVTTLAVLGLVVARRPPPTRHRPWSRPGRLAITGVVVVVVTVAVSAAAFRADTGLAGSAGQTALARHLADSGAVFYGAYW